jgi:hypothetical protein
MSQAGSFDGSGGGGSGSDVRLLTGNSGGAVGPLAHNINIVGAGGVTVAGNPGTHTLTISVGGAGFTWTVVTSADNVKALVAENGYIAKGAGVVQFILPAAAAIGDTFIIAGYGNLWTLAQNAFQSVNLGILTSTPGVLGTVSATHIKDSIKLVCVTANTEFQIFEPQGNILLT